MPIDFDDVMLERDYDPTRAYCQSKLAQVMHTFDLANLLGEVTATCLHPATYMPTKIVHHARGEDGSVDTLEEGAAATERLAVDPELEGVTGKYFMRTQEATANAQAYDAKARRQLRELSLSLCA
jgi:NAD(P)-dependent dehydrogenase (short-subunit alcohol dehydrogenase family)